MLTGITIHEAIRLLLPLIIIQILLTIFCLYKLTKDKVKFLPKWAWVLIIIFINFFGAIFYMLIGRERE